MSPDALPQAATGAAAGKVADFPAPSLCRMVIVHERRTLDPRDFAGVVTAVYPTAPGRIGVTVFPPQQAPYPISSSVPHLSQASETDAFAWSWPPRV